MKILQFAEQLHGEHSRLIWDQFPLFYCITWFQLLIVMIIASVNKSTWQ